MTPEQVRRFIQFDGMREGACVDSAQSILQSEGAAILWRLLRERGYAYLADEVGMGKTRQAMAVIATQFLVKPESRVVIICPGRTLQEQWLSEWRIFVQDCFTPAAQEGLRNSHPLWGLQPVLHDRLRDFAAALLLDEEPLHLLRYSSFRRPIWFADAGLDDQDQSLKIRARYEECLRAIGISDILPDTKQLFTAVGHDDRNGDRNTDRDELTRTLNTRYVGRIRRLLQSRPIDLLVFDEAQYLRHVGNRQNTHIRHLFGDQGVGKWLFLSATPLHNGPADIDSLDHYLCRRPIGEEPGPENHCADCRKRKPGQCDALGYARQRQRREIVDLLREFMVRRPRQYVDADDQHYGKTRYRNYRRKGADAASDPFYALTSALVQKRLVAALDGNNNRFRQGECSSFESLASSVARGQFRDHDGVAHQQPEIEPSDAPLDTCTTPDRALIDGLARSFGEAFRSVLSREPQHIDLPHAKMETLVGDLADRFLRDAPNHKALVFVRRLDTVDELLVRLKQRVQDEIDRRLNAWNAYLSNRPDLRREAFPSPVEFWIHRGQDMESTLGDADEPEEPALAPDRADNLPYFRAISKTGGEDNRPGLMYSFYGRLLRQDESPLRWLVTEDPDEEQQACWEQLIEIIYEDAQPPEWLCCAETESGDKFKRLQELKRCILQSMRRTDFVVDLYVLNRYLANPEDSSLTAKLLGFLAGPLAPEDLQTYVKNWREKLRRWCDRYELIREKSLQPSGADPRYDIDLRFNNMAPVVGRSGRIDNRNAVAQFKMPVHPNILVCTDVLKEGVDMHLFCDEVIHYGVAWTSGDLEQRIGRIDRFGSLISEKIRHYSSMNAEGSSAPRLEVGFPYLDGTLDAHQVNRVIRDKVFSDLRLDLGRTETELKEIDVDGLMAGSLEPAPSWADQSANIFSPDPPANDLELINCKIDEALTPKPVEKLIAYVRERAGSDGREVGLSLVPSRGLLRLAVGSASEETGCPSRPTHAGQAFDLWRLGKRARKRAWSRAQTAVFPARIDTGAFDAIWQCMQADHGTAPAYGVVNAPGFEGFEFDRRWQTLVRRFNIDPPYGQIDNRIQVVILEKAGERWILKSPLAPVGRYGLGEDAEAKDSRLDERIGAENARRDWGQLVVDRGLVWFAVTLFRPDCFSSSDMEGLLWHMARTGDRLQQLHCAADDEDWAYRSAIALSATLSPPPAPIVSQENDDGELSMNPDQALQQSYGRGLASLIDWFQGGFRQVLDAILQADGYHGNVMESVLDDLALEIDGNGRLSMRSVDQYIRFRLSATLDLSPALVERQENTFRGPRLITELAMTTATTGPIPSISLTMANQMPHEAPEAWTCQVARPDVLSIHFQNDAKRRRVLVYHAPSAMDERRQALVAAWASTLRSLRNVNFTGKKIGEHFSDALGLEKNS